MEQYLVMMTIWYAAGKVRRLQPACFCTDLLWERPHFPFDIWIDLLCFVRWTGEEDAEALFVEKAINAAADLLMEASDHKFKHGGTLTDEAEEYATVNSEAMRCLVR
jgi:hypothetical protein